MYLGVRAVIAKSIERIHKANLINFCIVPIEFADPSDYDKINSDDELQIDNLLDVIKNQEKVEILRPKDMFKFSGKLELSQRDREILLSDGLLKFVGKKAN